MKTTTKTTLALAAGIFSLAAQLHAQLPVGSHYPVGAEGLNGASLPPPGVYVRDYNFFYTASKVDGLGVDCDIFAYVQAPRLIWITPWQLLGANYGMDVIVPFAYKDVSLPGTSGYQFNLADIQIEPLLLSWHTKQFDIAAGYAVWAPTGKFGTSSAIDYLTSPGAGYWSHMLTLGTVWHPDTEKTWSLSLLGRYEICHEQDKTHVTPGNMATLEWGVSKNFSHFIDVGLVGYYQQQITEDDGKNAATALSHVVGVGPEVNVFWQKIGLFSSLRYVYEADSRDRPQGHTITLTLTKIF
jgi:hypothetical protein